MNKSLIEVKYILIIILFITLFSCSDSVSPAGKINVEFPETDSVSFQFHVQPFLKQGCAFAACHGDISPGSDIILTDFFTVTSRLGLVVAGNPDGSLLIQVLNGKNNPPRHTNIIKPNANQLQGLKRWIEDGALLN